MYKLLIVDDEILIRKGLHSIIPWERLGFTVVNAVGSGAEAIDIIKRQSVDVLLTDIQMPGMNGLSLMEEAKKRQPDIKVIIISGYDRFDYAVAALKLQADDYLLKPLKPEDVKAVFLRIGEVLDREREADKRRNRSVYAETEYGILRLICDELRDPEGFWRYFNGAVTLALTLVWYSGNDGGTFWRRLQSVLKDYYYIGTDTLYAIFTEYESLDGLLADIRRLITSGGFIGVRVSVSSRIYRVSDILQIFLDSADRLGRISDGEVAVTEQSRENGSISVLKNRLVENLEYGQSSALDKTLRVIIHEARGRDSAHIRILYSNLLLVLARYFRLEDTGGFELLKANSNLFSEGELHESLQNDVRLLQDILRRDADSAAFLVRQAREEIDRGYTDAAFSLTSVADKLNISYNYLSTLFSKEQGKSLKSYLTSLRMERARQLILDRERKIYQISEIVGYSNPRYFADAFRKYFGLSPTDYMKKLGENRDD